MTNVASPNTSRREAAAGCLLLWAPDGIATANLPGRLAEQDRKVGSVYALEVSTGLVKVGWTGNPRKRIQDHVKQAQIFGASVTRLWLSPAHTNFEANEGELIKFGRTWSESTVGNEYFNGLQFDHLVRAACQLTFEPPIEERTAGRLEVAASVNAPTSTPEIKTGDLGHAKRLLPHVSFSGELLNAAAVIVRHADCIGADAMRIVGLLKDAADCVASDDLRGTDGCLRKRETINAAKQVTAIAKAAVELDHKVREKLAAS